MHRYIPVIAKWSGFRKIGEKVVEHRKRKYGTTKFGLERFVNGFPDLASITFVGRFGKRPMHFFGALGSLFLYRFPDLTLSRLCQNILDAIQNDGKTTVLPRHVIAHHRFPIIPHGLHFRNGGLNSPERNSYLVEETLENHHG